MSFALVFATLVGIVLAGQEDMKYFLYENEKGEVWVEDLTVEPNLTASTTDLTYHFYSKKNPVHSVVLTIENVTPLKDTSFSASKDTIFIIHGWKATFESDVNSHIREYIIKDHDVNIFVVDWSPVAGGNYVSAKRSIKIIGEYVAEFIRILEESFSLKLSKVKFVGHSLGAHVSGCAGAALDGKVARIEGLDPAGPLFSDATDNRLDASDAIVVQGLHTNGGLLGFDSPLGHSDFYPNGGKSQPGCGLDITGACAHNRAYSYYAESLTSSKFVGTFCDTYESFTSGICDSNAKASMGTFHIDNRARGSYFLDTNKESPYAQG